MTLRLSCAGSCPLVVVVRNQLWNASADRCHAVRYPYIEAANWDEGSGWWVPLDGGFGGYGIGDRWKLERLQL